MRVLVVEDERRMAELLRQGLSEEGHAVTVAHDGRAGFDMAAREEFDVLVLDLMLPLVPGLEVARRLRAAGCRTPILMLTARDTTADVVAGLNAGADDYLSKPFSFDELAARIRAVGRRGPIPQPVILSAGKLTLNLASREVRLDGEPIELTRTEFALLETMMRNRGRVVTRDFLIDSVWGGESGIENNTIDSFVRLLRGKIGEPGRPSLIRTLRGVGYTLGEE